MKRTRPEVPPYLSFCLIVRNCEKTLPGVFEKCLQSIRKIAPDAELVVVDTMSSDETPDIAKRYADVFAEYRGPRGDWTREMEAFDDAAAARNESFRLAHGRWKAWIDADDILLWEQDAKHLLALNGRWRPSNNGTVHEVKGVDEKTPKSLTETLFDLEREMPEIKVFYAPYLYRSSEAGVAMEWQDRERIMRDDSHYVWKSEGHEICVPDKPENGTRPGYLSHLLYWHRKEFKAGDYEYSAKRHWAAMIRGYNEGTDRSTRTCLYLANFAHMLCPERVEEFLATAYESATIPHDRYRTLIDVARERAVNHRMADCYEHIHAAIGIYPDLPDAYLCGARIAMAVEDWVKAAEWFRRASECQVRPDMDASVTPRMLKFEAPSHAAYCNWRIAKALENSENWEGSLVYLDVAAAQARKVLENLTENDPDLREGQGLYLFYSNEHHALQHTLELQKLVKFLVDNDEPEKALALIDQIPHQFARSTLAMQLRNSLSSVAKHIEDPGAYESFYNNDQETGSIASRDEDVRSPKQAWRVIRTFAELLKLHKKLKRPLRIIDYGSFDGITGIPLLNALGPANIEHYLAVDVQQVVLNRFKERVDTWPELQAFRGKIGYRKGTIEAIRGIQADAIVCLEVIEHVSDPEQFTRDLLASVTDDGAVLFSTPWGSFDKGLPPATTFFGTRRDERGHLRALLPADAVEITNKAGGRVVDLTSDSNNPGGYGSSFCWTATPVRHVYFASARPSPVNFYVPAALWDWNASHVYDTGIGASEETIVFLAKALAEDKRRRVSVFGPLPINGTVLGEEVRDSVHYQPNTRYGIARGDGKVVVSRQPSLGVALEERLGNTPKILWLQDAVYQDLNAKVAEHYERIIVVSEWHKQAMHDRHEVPLHKMDVSYNFLVPEHFTPETMPRRTKHRFFWGSSPDRGLLNILEMWPAVLQKWPDATLYVYYGWTGLKKLAEVNPSVAPMFRKMWGRWQELRKLPGVVDIGRVNHERIALEMLASDVFWYPGSFEETGCLHGDTLISVPGDHRTGLPPRIPIRDLVGKENFPVYALDPNTRKFTLATCKKVWMTKIAEELVGLRLDDGSMLRLTPEHRVMNFDMDWVEAKDLKPGDRLTALHHRYDVYIKDTNGRWERESRMVGEWLAGRTLATDEHVDHLDPLRLDNRPDALQILSAAEHFSKTHKNKEMRRDQLEKRSLAAKEWARAHPEQVSEFRRAAQAAKTAGKTQAEIDQYNREQGLKAWETRRRKYGPSGFKPGVDIQALAKQAREEMQARIDSMSEDQREEHFRQRGLKAGQTRRDRDEFRQNHRVVETFRIPGPVPVYDMEVDRVHNFVADGVVVHNCSNASKARAAGCVPVVHPIAALPETAAGGVFYPARGVNESWEEYTARGLEALEQAFSYSDEQREEMRKQALDEYAVSVAEEQWKGWLK